VAVGDGLRVAAGDFEGKGNGLIEGKGKGLNRETAIGTASKLVNIHYRQ
jgi:hypothetical protein